MGLRSDTHRCRALVYGVERSSYQSNVAPKGVPHLSSVPHAVYTAHLAREESAHRAPQRWAFDDLSPLHMQALRQGRVSRPVSKGMHAGHKSEMGAGQVSGYVS